MTVLDRPAWHALKTRQSAFAVGQADAVRFDPTVSVFGGSRDESPEALQALAALNPVGNTVALVERGETKLPPGYEVARVIHAFQMVLDTPAKSPEGLDVVELTTADVPEMSALAELAKPGPFAARTIELGGYIGVKRDGRLAAMTGERLKPEGFTEVSAVCTHPDFRGQGLGAALTLLAAARIQARGEVPFLHVFIENPAVELYKRLGFKTRAQMAISVIKRVS